MKKKEEQIKNFDPNGVGINNGNFIGLPFDEETASIVLFSVPWDVTVSFAEGTALGPQNILECSPQLDLFDPDVPDAWKIGLYMRPSDSQILASSAELRKISKTYIDFLENGGDVSKNLAQKANLEAVNEACFNLKKVVFEKTSELLDSGKLVGLVGGDHSTPLGFLDALAERHKSFGILQIDAHMDLRKAYEGFEYSHASIFYNALKINNLEQLTQVGIRDFCEAEAAFAKNEKRVDVFYNHQIKNDLFEGNSWLKICKKIIKTLPQKVYISFDIDGLRPNLCPNTGTPVPGGLDFDQAMFLIKKLVESGREIIGFDLCEVAGVGNDWDGNVGARVLYKLSNFMHFSNQKSNSFFNGLLS